MQKLGEVASGGSPRPGRGKRVTSGRGLKLEGFELVSARGSVVGRGLAALRVETAGRGRVVGLGLVAGRAEVGVEAGVARSAESHPSRRGPRQGRDLRSGQVPTGQLLSHRSEDRPLHAERIRRSWEGGKCAARGPDWVLAVAVEGAQDEIAEIQAVRVRRRAGRGSRGCR
jgi:hypothetical protein